MKTWSIAINEDEADINTMPAALAKSLMPAKMGIKNPLRENGAQPSAKKDASPHLSLQQTVPAPAPIPYYHLPPQYYGPYNGPYHQPGYPPPTQVPVHVAASPKRPRQRSSSLPSEFDACADKLTDYIAWLIKRYPTKSEQLTACLETLKRKDIVFETLDTIDSMLWELWEVSDGIRLMLKCHKHKWERAEARRSR